MFERDHDEPAGTALGQTAELGRFSLLPGRFGLLPRRFGLLPRRGAAA